MKKRKEKKIVKCVQKEMFLNCFSFNYFKLLCLTQANAI